MATANLSLSVRGGTTDRQTVELRAGTPADAFSVGGAGSWRVNGPGVAGVHAYLYFDGTTLFVAAAQGSAVQLGGAVVGTDWKPVTAPAEINLGGSVFVDVREPGAAASPRERTTVAPGRQAKSPPAQLPARANPSRPQTSPPQLQGPPRAQNQGQSPVARPQPSARPQTQAPRPGPKPVRPPSQVQASPAPPVARAPTPAPVQAPAAAAPAAAAPGESDYDDSDAPTQYQVMPEGFLSGVQAPMPDSATRVQDVGPVEEPTFSDEKTHLMPPPSEGEDKTAQPQPSPARAAAEPAKPERPAPPSNRPPTDAATVVKPLEQFLAEAGGKPPGLPDVPDTTKRPLAPPAAGQPAERGAAGVIIAPPDPTRPPHDALRWAGEPGSPGAQLVPYGGAPQGYPQQQQYQQQQQYPQQAAYGQAQPYAQTMLGTGSPAYGQQAQQQPSNPYGQPMPDPMQAQQQYGQAMPGQMPGQMPYGQPGQTQGYPPPYAQQMPGQMGQPMPGQQMPVQQSGMVGFPEQQQPPWGMQQAPPAGNDILSKWKALPFARKLMFAMLPFGMIAFIIIFAPNNPPKKRVVKPSPSASVALTTSSSAPSTSVFAPPTGEPPPPASVASGSTAEPPPSAVPVPVPVPPPHPSASAEPPPKLAAGEVTLDRKAADAVAAGDVTKAVELYDQLAKEHPENPAYARAAEILRHRQKK